MKSYVKLFIVSFFSFILIFSVFYFALDALYVSHTDTRDTKVQSKKERHEKKKVLEREVVLDTTSRINVLAFGLNELLSDTMMLVSFEPNGPSLDILSIPRDTYYFFPGYDHPAQKKMNAIYGFGGGNGGPEGLKNVLSEFLSIPIHAYVRVDMEAVVGIVDSLGGYDVEVPYDMNYSDFAGNFFVDLKKGYQNLNGSQTLQFLRFRQNTSQTIIEGDVVRIPRQQAFVKSMIQKAIGKNLPAVLNTIISSDYVKTDLTLEETLSYGLKAGTLKADDIKMYTLEGESKNINSASYWIHDPEKLRKTLEKMYHVAISEDISKRLTDDVRLESTN